MKQTTLSLGRGESRAKLYGRSATELDERLSMVRRTGGLSMFGALSIGSESPREDWIAQLCAPHMSEHDLSIDELAYLSNVVWNTYFGGLQALKGVCDRVGMLDDDVFSSWITCPIFVYGFENLEDAAARKTVNPSEGHMLSTVEVPYKALIRKLDLVADEGYYAPTVLKLMLERARGDYFAELHSVGEMVCKRARKILGVALE